MMLRRSARQSPGALDQRISIVRQIETPDGSGGVVVTELVMASCWAAVMVMGGRETNRAQQLTATANYRFTIRNRPGIVEHDWIIWDGVRYNIRALLTNGRRDLYLDIDAERGVAD